MHAHDAGALHDADDHRRQRPLEPFGALAIEHLADEVLVRDGYERRVAERDDLLEPTGQLQRVQRVLVEVMAGIDDDPLGRHPRPQRAIDPPA